MANAFIIILAIVIILFFWLTGTTLTEQLGIQPPEDTATPPTPNGSSANKEERAAVKNVRIFASNYRSRDPKNEYIEIQADFSNTEGVNITGWILQNRDGKKFEIPQAAGLPYTGRVNAMENVQLLPGQKAIVITGKSPFNVSFRPNICTGYFNRFYEFTPRLSENCPMPDKEIGVDDESNECFLYLKSLPRCSSPLAHEMPSNVDFSCKDFINQKLSYAACVENHRAEEDFFADEWRIYLDQNQEIWSDIRENIRLFDREGTLRAEYPI